MKLSTMTLLVKPSIYEAKSIASMLKTSLSTEEYAFVPSLHPATIVQQT